MSGLIDHVRLLSDEIGPRPAGTDAEHQASEWIASMFEARGLATEVQEFDYTRGRNGAFALYNLLLIACAFLAQSAGAHWGRALLAFVLASALVWLRRRDADFRGGLSSIMPKGVSQNVIARQVPKSRRGEKVRRVVLVAHYDSPRSSLLFGKSLVKLLVPARTLESMAAVLVPVLALAIVFAPKAADRWLGYGLFAMAVLLLAGILVVLQRRLFGRAVAGGNDNASGVAVLLGAMERLIPAPDAATYSTGVFERVRSDEATARAAGVVPDGAELSYRDDDPDGLLGDFEWADSSAAPRRARGATIEGSREDKDSSPALDAVDDDPAPRRSWNPFARRAEKKPPRLHAEDADDAASWLGVDSNFNARKAGASIGSWDNFGDEDDDEIGWKGGRASGDVLEDPDFAANEAARIRLRATDSVDRDLFEREIWFVATGAGSAGCGGMRALFADYGDELADALIVNLLGLGGESLAWASVEGVTQRHRAAQRIVGLVRRVSRETEILIKPRALSGISTDATYALAHGAKALTLSSIEAHGLPAYTHQRSDVASVVDAANLEVAADFVASLVREA